MLDIERKLSKLQKAILMLAYQNQTGQKTWLTLMPADVSNREVLHKIYGFPIRTDNHSYKLIFDRHEIGLNRYQSASVAVAKSFNRLVKRGVAVRHYSCGIALTVEGMGIAKRLISLHIKKGATRS